MDDEPISLQTLHSELQKGFKSIGNEITGELRSLRQHMDKKLDELNSRLDDTNSRLDEKLNGITHLLLLNNEAMEDLEGPVIQMNTQLVNISSRLRDLERIVRGR